MLDSAPEQADPMGGEYLGEDHLKQIRDTWLPTHISNVEPLLPTTTEFLEFEPHASDKENISETIKLPVEHNHGIERRTKVIISAAAAASLTGFGIAVLMRGRFSPKARKQD